MSEHTYRVVELVGTSPDGTDAAIRNGLSRAAQTTKGLDWFKFSRCAARSKTAPSRTSK